MADLVLDIIQETVQSNEEFKRRLAALILGTKEEGKDAPETGHKTH